MGKLRILMLEDNPDDAGLIQYELQKEKIDFTFQRVDTREEFIEAISETHPHVVLSDHALPQFNSMEALKVCQDNDIDVPFILITGTVSEEFAVECLKNGVDDYILKANLSRLPLAIKAALKKYEDERQKIKAQKSLETQNQKLLKINRELDSFVYSVSHNLRGPLTSIQGVLHIAEIQAKQPENDPATYFELIRKSVLNLESTIDNIVHYSRNSRTGVEKEQVEVNTMINEIISSLEYMPDASKIEIVNNVPDNFTIVTNRYRLWVIFNNILVNAFKYLDTTKERPFIKIHSAEKNGMLQMIIEDNGIGIEKEYLNKIFDMFYRATPNSDGAGLGLYIVKETIDRLEGNISVQSEWKKGTTVTISLPQPMGNIP